MATVRKNGYQGDFLAIFDFDCFSHLGRFLLVHDSDFQGVVDASFSPLAIVPDGFFVDYFFKFQFWKPPWPSIYIHSLFFICRYPYQIMTERMMNRLQNLTLGITDEPITLPAEVCDEAASSTPFSIVAMRLNPRKQNLRALALQLPRLWGVADSVNGRVIGPDKVQFRFPSEETMNLILRRSPWSFAEWMVTLHRWSPNLSDDASKVIPFWIQIRGIPLQYLTEPMIRFIGDILAPVVDVDFDENLTTRVDFVRVKVLWNTDHPLRFQRNFQFGQNEYTILSFKYERLRCFCQTCGMLTHDRYECPLRDDADDDAQDDDNNDRGDDDPNDDNMAGGNSPEADVDANVLPRFADGALAEPDEEIPEEGTLNLNPDQDLLAEHSRYFEAKHGSSSVMVDQPVDVYVQFEKHLATIKRKRDDMEAALESPPRNTKRMDLYPLSKKDHGDSDEGGTSLDRGAGGPVLPQSP